MVSRNSCFLFDSFESIDRFLFFEVSLGVDYESTAVLVVYSGITFEREVVTWTVLFFLGISMDVGSWLHSCIGNIHYSAISSPVEGQIVYEC